MGVSLIKVIFSGEDLAYVATLLFIFLMEYSSGCLYGRIVAGVGGCGGPADADGRNDGGGLRSV